MARKVIWICGLAAGAIVLAGTDSYSGLVERSDPSRRPATLRDSAESEADSPVTAQRRGPKFAGNRSEPPAAPEASPSGRMLFADQLREATAHPSAGASELDEPQASVPTKASSTPRATSLKSIPRESTPVEWCRTEHRESPRGQQRSLPACAEGPCGEPSLRDAYVPGGLTPLKWIRVRFHVFCEDNGTDCAATATDAADQIVQMNADYAPYRVRLTHTTVFHNDSDYRNYWEVNDEAMRNAYAESPATQCNIYVVDVEDGWLGWGTFPWEDDALTATGGIVIHEGSFGAAEHTLTHEMGHTIGLWHTHHGVYEVPPCSECYEMANGVDGDITGDMCSDTAATPRNFSCPDPGGTDGCSGTAWGSTDTQNYMSYAPDPCYTEFSTQQSGRFHCWINDKLTGWLASGEKYCPACYTNAGNRTTCESGDAPDDWISNVSFNTINNSTGSENNGCSYGDYTGLSTVVSPGSTHTLSVTFCSEGQWVEQVRAWFDWNRNSVFDTNESYFLGSGTDATVSAAITVPSGAATGCTRMRVIEQYGSDPGSDGACPFDQYGEAEDYTVCVTGAGCEDLTVYQSGTLGLTIPDDSATGASHTINVPDAGSVNDLNVDLDISHNYVGDLCVTLTHAGMTVTLIQRIGNDSGLGCDAEGCCGCYENNFADIILDDEGVGGLVNNQCTANLTSPPSYIPEFPLSAFNGASASGDWVITVNDNASPDAGTLNSWSLHICGITTVVCGGPDAGECCEDNGTPGCSDETCCESVCSYDPWCCVNNWDDVCAGEAVDDPNCTTGSCACGDPNAGDCCVSNNTPGCDDPVCCGSVCDGDPYCCDVTWDGQCASAAAADPNCACAGCGDPAAGDCCVNNGSPGCGDATCCNAVCAINPSCCDTLWDQECADLAAADAVNCPPCCLLYDMNYDGFPSIIGDVPPFVDCVFFGNCNCPGLGCVCAGDCNCDGFLSIIGDVPCFVDCVYFGNCADCPGRSGSPDEGAGFTIGGAVYEDEDEPLMTGLEGITVNILDDERRTVGSARTAGPFGLWRIDNLPEGRYAAVLIGGGGEVPGWREVIKITVNAENEAANQSIQLLRKGDVSRRPVR